MITTTCSRQILAAGVVALVLGATTVNAQNPSPAPAPSPAKEIDIMLLQNAGAPGVPFTLPFIPGMGMDFTELPMAVAGETVTDAPYSAEAVTEVVQSLADGNRIVRRNTATVYRDSTGRTRREQSLAILGPLVGGTEQRRVQITDPKAGVTFDLDMGSRRAHKMPSPKVKLAYAPAAPDAGDSTFQIALPPAPGGPAAHGAVVFRQGLLKTQAAPLVEQLGTQVIEGVVAEGTRSTITIPAGAIGNEQAIHVVSERWTSPDLKVLVQSRQLDPRFGETTYRLTNIVRAEPSPDLFEVPPDFAVVGPNADGDVFFRIERK